MKQTPGIKIVPKLEKSMKPKKFDEKDLAGYLFVYFKDQDQSAYMAISADGYTFTDINKGQPIFIGSELAEQKGVRDPHITRGPDGAFYLAMTDLHIFGKRAGFRDTDWQRPIDKYGWGNNRALVLMKSYDLIHWTHSNFRVDLAFPELGGLDGDITKVGDEYHMFYVSDARILHSVSDKINEGYQPGNHRIDPESVNTEAPNLFKRLGTNNYVLMYDVYGLRPSNMGFSETADFINYTNCRGIFRQKAS